MTSSDLEVLASALAYHPPVVIGTLLVFQYIKRRRFYLDKDARELAASASKSDPDPLVEDSIDREMIYSAMA